MFALLMYHIVEQNTIICINRPKAHDLLAHIGLSLNTGTLPSRVFLRGRVNRNSWDTIIITSSDVGEIDPGSSINWCMWKCSKYGVFVEYFCQYLINITINDI